PPGVADPRVRAPRGQRALLQIGLWEGALTNRFVGGGWDAEPMRQSPAKRNADGIQRAAYKPVCGQGLLQTGLWAVAGTPNPCGDRPQKGTPTGYNERRTNRFVGQAYEAGLQIGLWLPRAASRRSRTAEPTLTRLSPAGREQAPPRPCSRAA